MITDPSNQHDDLDDELEPKSRSQIKREIQEFFTLGEKIANLPVKQRRSLPLDEEIREEVELISGMAHREARRRQLRHLAKMLRQIDIEPLHRRLDSIENGRRDKAQEFQALEQLRDRVLQDSNAGIDEVLQRFPTADRQHLSQLKRNAKKELENSKPPASTRKLFKYIRKLNEE